MAATYPKKMMLDHFVLFRTNTHAAMEEKMEMMARERTVIITLSRSAERKLKVGLFQISVRLVQNWLRLVGRPTGLLMMSALVRMELNTTMTKGSINRMNKISVTISRTIVRPLWGLYPAMRSMGAAACLAIMPPPPCSCSS